MQMLSLLLVPLMAPPLAESCSANQNHPHFLKRNPPLFRLNKNSTATEQLCAIQLRGLLTTRFPEPTIKPCFRTWKLILPSCRRESRGFPGQVLDRAHLPGHDHHQQCARGRCRSSAGEANAGWARTGSPRPEQSGHSSSAVQREERQCDICHQGWSSLRQLDGGGAHLQSGALLRREESVSGASYSPLPSLDQGFEKEAISLTDKSVMC